MNKKLQLLVLFLSIGIYTTIFAQTPQSNFINYQGVASDAAGEVMTDQSITVGIVLRPAPTGAASYAENHSVTTDTNGVFSLKIGSGTATTSTYDNFQWSDGIATFVTVSINGTEIGTTELLAVPYAIKAGNTYWSKEGDDIENLNTGTVKVGSNLEVSANIQLQLGPAANEISIDGTLAGNSDKALPTEKAVKTYIDNNSSGVTKIDDLSDAKSDNDGSSLFLGIDAGASDDGTNNLNLGIGFQALSSNTVGSYNTAIGYEALRDNTTGGNNTANGLSALRNNTTGSDNTAIGSAALRNNTTGFANTANGAGALQNNTTGVENTANGRDALLNNTTGFANTANGRSALIGNTTGSDNTAIGRGTLGFNNGDGNTAIGRNVLGSNSIGSFNTAIGRQALERTTASYNVAVGNDALNDLTTGSNNIGIGADSQVPSATGNHQVRIGNNQITYAGIQVAWTITSDAAWKDDIQPLPYGLDMVSQLKPVDYVRKNNENSTREIGFIAQDVEVLLNKLGYANSGILTTADNGRLSLRYNDFIPVLTKAVQEQQEIIMSLQSTVYSQQSEINRLNNDFQALLQRIKTLENK